MQHMLKKQLAQFPFRGVKGSCLTLGIFKKFAKSSTVGFAVVLVLVVVPAALAAGLPDRTIHSKASYAGG